MLAKFIIIFFGFFVDFCLAVVFLYRPITVRNSKSTVIINGHEISVDIAKTEKEREQGLSGRETLALNQGMLFLFPFAGLHGFWMKDMKFPIDIVWIAKNKIVGFTENIDPQIGVPLINLKIYYPPKLVDAVLELKAGEVNRLKLEVDDLVDLRE